MTAPALPPAASPAAAAPVPAAADGWEILPTIASDLRHAVRALSKAPGFSLAVVLTLALCIGANTTISSVLYALLLKPLPFRDSGQLVEVYNTYPKSNLPKSGMSVAQYLDYKEHADRFEGFAISFIWPFTVGEESSPQREPGEYVTYDYFTLLGVTPHLGRFFTAENNVPGANRVMVLTQSFWERYYNADPSVVGREVKITGQIYTILGVAPRSVESMNAGTMAFTPYIYPAQIPPETRFRSNVQMLWARLKPGVPLAAGLAQLDALERRFHEQQATPALREHIERTGHHVSLGRVRDEQLRDLKQGLMTLQGGVLFVLLIGCVNVANLLLARSNARQGEMAVRQALGAGRMALARPLFAEAAVLTFIGAAAGVTLAWAGLKVINAYLPSVVRQPSPIAIDTVVLELTLAISFLVAGVITLLPVTRLWRDAGPRGSLVGRLQGGTRGSSSGRSVRLASGALVTAQVAIALVLLIGAGLMIRSFANASRVNYGFDVKRFVAGRVLLPPAYQSADKSSSLQDYFRLQLQEIPGVEAVGLMANVVMGGDSNSPQPYGATGSEASDPNTRLMAYFFAVSPEYFSALTIRVLEGREFNADDRTKPVVIIDRALAERHWPGRSALGEKLQYGAGATGKDGSTIIGVVENTKINGPEDRIGFPVVYYPLYRAANYTLLLRTERRPEDLLRSVREKLRTIDSSVPLYMDGSLQSRVDFKLQNTRGITLLLGAFAGLALLLSAVGIYGMLAYDVTQRTREIGIRAALGATRGQIIGLILRQGLWKISGGVVIGLGVAFYLSRFLANLLYDVRTTDPFAFIGVSILLLLVGLLASYLPARRAAKVDPLVALRQV